jgi:hypothetical protein
MSDDEKPLDPEAARFVAKVRRLLMIASATTFLAVAVVIGVIGYRVFKVEGSAPPAPDVMAALPAGAKVISTAVGDGRIVLTVEIAGATELRIFDLHTLKALGRIRLSPQP